MESNRGGWLLGGVLVVGAAAVGLVAADVQSPARQAVVVAFVICGPALAIGGLLRGFDPFARAILALTATLVLLTLTAMIMVVGGFWNPTGGLLIVAGLTTVCLAAQWPPIARHAGLLLKSRSIGGN